MNDSSLKEIPWRRFREFLAPCADRFAVLQEMLEQAGLYWRALETAGARHLLTAPLPPEDAPPRRSPPLLVAHYDRAPGSPGANDNSAGAFILLESAITLKRSKAEGWTVIFTDKEELGRGQSIMAQGAYALARELKSLKMDRSKIFCFDACGTGDTLIISTTADYLLKGEEGGEKLQKAARGLRETALETARNLGMAKVLLSPTPFSDDAGFLRAGFAAQTITMLPSPECIPLAAALRRNPEFAGALISAELRQKSHAAAIPETWRCLNSPSDSHLRLTPQHFRAVSRFAQALCQRE